MPDPNLEVRGGGGRCPKQFFSALRASVWSKNKEGAASSTGFPKAKWGLGNSRAREKRERGLMGTSVERERGVSERERERELFLPFPSLPLSPLSLIINSISPSDRERLGTRQLLK